jgi:hypothetical protein
MPFLLQLFDFCCKKKSLSIDKTTINRSAQTLQFCVIKLITMTHTYNITAINGNVLVAVLPEDCSQIPDILPEDTLGTPWRHLTDTTFGMAMSGQYPGNPQAISVQYHYYKDAIGCTGQPIIQQLNIKHMAKKTATNGVSANRIKHSDSFERTRENNEEFGRAGKAAKLLRTIFRDVSIYAKDLKTQGRLTKVTSRVVLGDPISERGKRTANNGDVEQLEGFHFNERAGIKDVLFVKCPVNYNRVSGEVTVNIPSFVPRQSVQKTIGNTHFRILAAAAAVNFDTEKYEYAMQTTAEFPYNMDATQETTLTLALPPNSTDIVVAALGIEYYQKVNSRIYALKSGEHNATTIVLVDKAA